MLPLYNPDLHIPPPPAMATLSVTPKGVLRLHATVRQALGLYHGQPIDLVPPPYGSMFWHLDLRKTAPRRVLWHDNTSVRALGIRLPPGLVTEPLTFYLMPGEPEHANYYPLLPANALAPQ